MSLQVGCIVKEAGNKKSHDPVDSLLKNIAPKGYEATHMIIVAICSNHAKGAFVTFVIWSAGGVGAVCRIPVLALGLHGNRQKLQHAGHLSEFHLASSSSRAKGCRTVMVSFWPTLYTLGCYKQHTS